MQNQVSIRHEIAEIRRQITDIITQLASIRLTSDEVVGRTVKLATLVDALPFPSDHYAVTKNRLRNAQRYFVCGEIGAARYELRLVLGQLGRTFL